MITCTRCKLTKLPTDFDLNNRKKNGRRSDCKKCRAAEYLANVEKNRADRRTHARRNPIQAALRHQRWVSNNPARLYTYQWQYRNDPTNRERKAKLKRDRSADYTARERARYARRRQALPAWANAAAMRAFYESAHGLSMLVGEWYEVDHVVPITSPMVCGLHCEANMQVLHARENASKSNRWWPDMWTIDATVNTAIHSAA